MDIEPLIVKSAFLPRGHVLCNVEDYEIVERIVDSYLSKQNQPVTKSATSEDAFPSAIKWTGKNLREVIDLTGWNESASSKWTWAEYEQVVEEKGLKIFTPSGSVMADIGDWIIYNGKDYYVTAQKTKSATTKEVAEAISWAQGMEIYYEEKQMSECANCAKTAITALQAYQPWIPCTERMPTEDDADEDGFVLTLDADRQQTDYPHSEIELWNNRCDVKITHWRPMLPIPKGERT